MRTLSIIIFIICSLGWTNISFADCDDEVSYYYDESQDQWYEYNCETGEYDIPVDPEDVVYPLDEIVVTSRPYDEEDEGWIYRFPPYIPDFVNWLRQIGPSNHYYDIPSGSWENTPSITLTINTNYESNFLSSYNIYATISVGGGGEADSVNWAVEVLAGGGSASLSSSQGSATEVSLNPSSAPSGRDYGLSYRISAYLDGVTDKKEITQDDVAMLRQEYVDMGKSLVPSANEFSSASPAYQGPSPWGLLYENDLDSYHDSFIINFINQRATATDNNYTGSLGTVTAGYACPRQNTHTGESQHIYGKAFDFDAGTDDSTHSYQNYLMYNAGKNSPASAVWSRLYEKSGSTSIELSPPYSWPPSPGDSYDHGHHDWRGW